jgi:low affinity Fe/Cu permease
MPSSESKPVASGGAVGSILERFSGLATEWSGSSAAFALAALTILVWLVTGPVFGFSDTWQLVINTGTTIVTFLMVFLIQRSQNKDSQAIHLKLNELVAAVRGASNRLINVEGLTEEEIKALHDHYGKLVELAKSDSRLTQSHSVEEAAQRHSAKKSEEGRGRRNKTAGRVRKKKEDPGGGQ